MEVVASSGIELVRVDVDSSLDEPQRKKKKIRATNGGSSSNALSVNVCNDKKVKTASSGVKKGKDTSTSGKEGETSLDVTNKATTGNKKLKIMKNVKKTPETATQGEKKISKKHRTLTNAPRMQLLKKVRYPAQVTSALSKISDQLLLFPDNKLRELFLANGIADIRESQSKDLRDAATRRKERSVSYCEKSQVAFLGREAVNTLMVIFYNPASVCVLVEEIQRNDKEYPAHILIVRFDSAFVAIITDSNVQSRFPYRSLVERGDSSSCFMWFSTKEISWTQKFPVHQRRSKKMEVLQKATPLSIVGHILATFFEAKSQPWVDGSTNTDKKNYHLYLKPILKFDDDIPITNEDMINFSWVKSITEFVSRFSVVKRKAVQVNSRPKEVVCGSATSCVFVGDATDASVRGIIQDTFDQIITDVIIQDTLGQIITDVIIQDTLDQVITGAIRGVEEDMIQTDIGDRQEMQMGVGGVYRPAMVDV